MTHSHVCVECRAQWQHEEIVQTMNPSVTCDQTRAFCCTPCLPKVFGDKMEQPSLFDRVRAAELRDRAITQAEKNARQEWRDAAFAAVLDVALRQTEFTTEDVWKGLDKPREPRALGAVMRQLAREGRIEPTSRFVNGTMTTRHRAPIRVWRTR